MAQVTELKEGVESELLVQKPFTKKYLDEDKEDTGSEIISLRINPKERELINLLKKLTHYDQDAKVIKIGLKTLRNVIQGTFSDDLMFKLTDGNRRRNITDGGKAEQ